MKTLVRLLLATLVLTGFHLAVGASPAIACSCAMAPDDVQSAESAAAVFVADLVKYTAPPQRATMSSGDPAVWTFAVSAVYKGKVAAQQDVVSAVSGATCGLELPQSGRFLVFAQIGSNPPLMQPVGGQPLFAGLCGGTRSLTGAVPTALGDPNPPIPGTRSAEIAWPTDSPPTSTPESADPAASTTAPTATAAGPGRDADWATAATVATGGVALGLAALLISRRVLKPKDRI